MAEYTAAALQIVDADQNILFTGEPVPCSRGWVIHREGSGVFVLRGVTDKCAALYRIAFNGNIQIPDGGTAAPISITIAVDGEQLPESRAIYTPVNDAEFGNVSATAIIRVPRGCCAHVSIINSTVTNVPIDVQNANLEITRLVS